jgi:DNA-nicking Smr family endonuclease
VGRGRRNTAGDGKIPEINLKEGMPRVQEAMSALEQALTRARESGIAAVKFIHGYGSSGVGGEIRMAVQKRLREMESSGQVRACIFGEEWSTSDARAWTLLKARPELKRDPHVGKRNLGITVVVI